MGGEDQPALEAAVEELSRCSYALTEKLYATLGSEEEAASSESDET